MVTLFTDPRMVEHVTPSHHPERPERLSTILRQLKRTGLLFSCRSGEVREATDDELALVHSPEYLAEIHRVGQEGGGQVEADTWMSPGSEMGARLAAGGAVGAVLAVLDGQSRRAFCAVRPPGHHARPSHAMGFCLYGNVAAAAAVAIDRREVDRVLVVDFDVHHGNGTQEMFYEDPRVAFLSIHRYPFYPGTGAADETGTRAGLGQTRNVPIRYGTSRADYHSAFLAALEVMADRARPELVLISAGFDAHAEDPIGDLGLEVEDFDALTRAIIDVAETHASGRLVSVLEGGYNLPILAGCVESHLLTLGAQIDPVH